MKAAYVELRRLRVMFAPGRGNLLGPSGREGQSVACGASLRMRSVSAIRTPGTRSGLLVDESKERVARPPEQEQIVARDHGCSSRLSVDERDLAEEVPGAKRCELPMAAQHVGPACEKRCIRRLS
jgi:hypothetical protein